MHNGLVTYKKALPALASQHFLLSNILATYHAVIAQLAHLPCRGIVVTVSRLAELEV